MNNPVNNTANIVAKTANLRALGFNSSPGTHTFDGVTGEFDGFITLNTSSTNPGSPGTTNTYSLFSVASHEIDEVLGLGSALPDPTFGGQIAATPTAQDLFRYTAGGARTFTTADDDAFFSLNGTTDIVQFNQSGGRADYGDWHTSGTPRVQDAFATPGSSPVLGPAEYTALDVIGYNLQSPTATPEFGSVFSLGGLLLAGGTGVWWQRRRRKA